MQILLTGGTGLVGSYLVPRLIGMGHGVDVVTRSPQHMKVMPGLRAVRADLGSPNWIREASINDQPLDLVGYEGVVHLAYATTNNDAYDRQVTTESVEQLVNALDEAGGQIREVVLGGSMTVFGAAPGPGRVDEQAPRVGDTPYAANKIAAARALADRRGSYRTTVLHPTGVYDLERSKRIAFYTELFASGYIVTQAGARGTTNIVHADDVAAAIVGALARGGGSTTEEYVINGESMTYAEWFDLLAAWVGTASYRRLPRFAARLRRLVPNGVSRRAKLRWPVQLPAYKTAMFEHHAEFDSGKARRDFGFIPAVFLRDLCGARNPH